MSSFSGPYNEGIATRGLAVYYDADELSSYPGSGSTWANIVAASNNGTISGATYINDNNSVYLDGSSSAFISTPYNSVFEIGNNDYTVEAWVNLSSFGEIVGAFNIASPFPGWLFSTNFSGSAGRLSFYHANSSTTQTLIGTGYITANTWTHISMSKQGSTLRFFINGVLDSTHVLSLTSTGSNQQINIGADSNSTTAPGRRCVGYISNLRIIKGRALYTSNFAISSSRLTATSDTVLLTCYGTPADTSKNKLAITFNGTTSGNSASPFIKNFKTFNFDGTGDYVPCGTLPLTSNLVTVCGWFKRGATATSYTGALFGFGTDAASTQDVYFWGDTNQFGFNTWNGDCWGFNNAKSPGEAMDGGWHYIAAVFNRSSLTSSKIYVDGVQKTLSQVKATTLARTPSNNFAIGMNGWDTGDQLFQGGISRVAVYDRELSLVEIQQNYDADCEKYGKAAISSTPTVVSSGIVLHLDASNESSYPKTGTSWFDVSGNNNTGSINNSPTFSTSDSGSFTFNGSNQYVFCGTGASMNLGSVASIAAWVKTSSTGVWKWICQYGRHQSTQDRTLAINDQNKAIMYMYGTNAVGTTTVTDGKWHYLVGTVDGTSSRIYVDGVLEATTAATFGAYTYSGVRVGINDGLGSYPFNGNIATVVMYNRALSAAEILQNFEAQRTRFRV